MQVTSVKNFNTNFEGLKKKNQKHKYGYYPTPDEINIAKTKRTISECKFIAIGIAILYFAMKKNFKNNGIKAMEAAAAKKASMIAPIPQKVNLNPEGFLGV